MYRMDRASCALLRRDNRTCSLFLTSAADLCPCFPSGWWADADWLRGAAGAGGIPAVARVCGGVFPGGAGAGGFRFPPAPGFGGARVGSFWGVARFGCFGCRGFLWFFSAALFL